MDSRERSMDDLDFLADFRLDTMLGNGDLLLKSGVAQHPELQHLVIGYLHRLFAILVLQKVKGRRACRQEGSKLFHRHREHDKHIIVNDRDQHASGLLVVGALPFHIPHGDETRDTFLPEEVTYRHLVSVEGADHHPFLFFFLHFLPFFQQA